MNYYDEQTIDLQLYQVEPGGQLLGQPASDVAETISQTRLLEDNVVARKGLAEADTLGSVFEALRVIESRDYRSRAISLAMNRFLEHSSITSDLPWSSRFGGIALNEPAQIRVGDYRSLLDTLIAEFRFDTFTEQGIPRFSIFVRHKLGFSVPLRLDAFAQFIADRNKVWLPVFDSKRQSNFVLQNVQFKELYHYEPQTFDNPEPKRIGERFIDAGRMTQEEYASLSNDKASSPVAWVKPYGRKKDKNYCFPARDLEISASDSLLSLQNNVSDAVEIPDELLEAIGMYRGAKADIRDQMEARAELIDTIESVLSGHFSLAPPLSATCNFIQIPQYPLKGRPRVNEAVREGRAYHIDSDYELGTNVLCYPLSESNEERRERFNRFFKPSSKVGQIGIEFQHVTYSARVASKEPIKTVEHILSQVDHCDAALLAWPGWNRLPNNKPIEFELMRRNIATQHVVNENFKADAPKISALIKGMAEKFPVKDNVRNEERSSIKPFDLALGLDVSRHGIMDVASFPVVIDDQGRVSCTLSETPYTQDREKRSEQEILKVINGVLEDHGLNQGQSVNLLFLRDGLAFEDYDLVAQSLPDNVTLTVVSVRKNLMSTCSKEMPEGEYYSLFAVNDTDRFVFGVNARQGNESKVTRLHLAEMISNPLSLDMESMAYILIGLACQNKTTEAEIASLPFPIAYADRMAGDIRSFIDDNQLQRHVQVNYPEEVSNAGGPSLFIYREIRRFVKERANGYSFAI